MEHHGQVLGTHQYLYGSRYLVAPVMAAGVRERSVYVPASKWRNVGSDDIIESTGSYVTIPAPLDVMPVLERLD